MEKINGFERGHFSLLPGERERAKKEGNLAELEKKMTEANARIANGEDVEIVIKGTPAIFSLLEQRELIKETELEHDKMRPVPAHEFGQELAKELGDDEQIAA